MKLLLDTHVFIWWVADPGRISSRAREQCEDPANSILVSLASIWEIQIKYQLGKLELKEPLSELIENQKRTNKIALVPIALDHILELQNLPPAHRDPFDRMLAVQAITEQAVLVSHDSVFKNYPVDLLW